MHTTYGYVISKPRDFKICLNCGRINWYENESCINCYSSEFRRATKQDAENLELEIQIANELGIHRCEECPMDV